jgi:hypothetical protein
MLIKSRLQRLEWAAKEIRRRRKAAEEAAAERERFRELAVAAGVRSVDRFNDLTSGEQDEYLRFYDIDWERDNHEMPCSSWLIKDRHGEYAMWPVWYWHCELKRGAMTREEYNRRVLEHAGLAAPAESSGSGPAIASVLAGGETSVCELHVCGSSSGV